MWLMTLLASRLKTYSNPVGRHLGLLLDSLFRDCETQHLQQLKARCDEELQILCREAEDMVELYQKQKSDLHACSFG